MRRATIYPGQAAGSVCIPPSKSMAHRAIICAALAAGESRLSGLKADRLSNDIQTTITAMQRLGADIAFDGDDLVIRGGRLGMAADEEWLLDCGESGSTLRFLIPIVALLDLPIVLLGHGRLPERPQTVYEEIFASQGLCLRQTPAKDGWLVRGRLQPGDFTLRGDISSQFISGLLFALPLLPQDSTLHILPPFESRSYVELTLASLEQFGVEASWRDDFTLHIKGGQHYKPARACIEGDFSQLAFFAVLGSIAAPEAGIAITGVNPRSRQGDRQIVEIIRQMNGRITEQPNGYLVQPAALRGTDIDLANCPDLGPVLTVLAAFAEGQTRIYNAGRLRLKESDRIADVMQELKRCGVRISASEDEMLICSSARAAYQAAESCLSHNDHRIVMALAVLGAAMEQPLEIRGAEAVNKSYPDFFEDLQKLGIKVELSES